MSNNHGPYTHPYATNWTAPNAFQSVPDEDRTAAALAHGSTLISMVVSGGWLSFVGPLVIWFLYKDRSTYVRHAAAGAFNFNIWLTLATIIGWLLTFTVILAWIGIPLLVIAMVLQLWSHLRATLRALKGKHYEYPFQTRILN